MKQNLHVFSFSTKGKVTFIMSLFVFISLVLAMAIYMQGEISNGIRTYVRGEGLWAKAQKNAMLFLERYSYTHSESDYLAYQKALEVIYGDQKARNALLQTPPNIEMAKQGFLEGQNDPEDIDSLICFFLKFHNISYMENAVLIWMEADSKINDMVSIGKEMHTSFAKNKFETEHIIVLRTQLQTLNSQLFLLENKFSHHLSEGARTIKYTMYIFSLLILSIFIGISIYISRKIINSITLAEDSLKMSDARFKSLFDSNTIGIVSWQMNGAVNDANEYFLNMIGYQHSDLQEEKINWRALTPSNMFEKDLKAIDELLAFGKFKPFEKYLIHKDGSLVPIYIGASLLHGKQDEGIAYIMDLTERKKAEEQSQLTSIVFESTYDGILITDSSLKIIAANKAFCRMTGYEEDDLKDLTPKIFQSGSYTAEMYREMWDSLRIDGHFEGDMLDRMKDGSVLPIRISINIIKNHEDEVTHYVAIFTDITERKNQEERLNFIAQHDALTSLPNRILFDDRIKQILKRAERKETKFALAFLDLDKFKPVNDQFGHKIGDKLLQMVAKRLLEHTREMDTVTRLGGDEFVILFEDIIDRITVEKMMTNILEAISAPYGIEGNQILIGASAGIAIYPENGFDSNSLLHFADGEMYRMKNEKMI